MQVFPVPLNTFSHINLRYLFSSLLVGIPLSPPVSLFKTTLIILIGNFRPEIFLGDIFSCIITVHAKMAYWDTVRVWLLVWCACPSSCNVSSSFCLTRSVSLAECWFGYTLGGVAGRFGSNNTCWLGTVHGTSYTILFAGTTPAGNLRFGFTLGGGEGFSVTVVTLGHFKGGTGDLLKIVG